MGPESLGWCPDLPDARDFQFARVEQHTFPGTIDLREYEIGLFEEWHQPDSHMSCAVSLLCMLDWQQRKWSGQPIDGSPKFLYDLTIRVWGGGGRTGIGLRSSMKTLRRFGTPPRSLLPRKNGLLLDQPEMFGFAESYKSMAYIRLDSSWQLPSGRINMMKYWLVQGSPFLLGFAVPNNITRASTVVPLDMTGGGTIGGTAGIVMGFDDLYPVASHIRGHQHRIQNLEKGAFLIRTCWGKDWGNDGFVWLPYAFVECRFASDAWAIQISPP